MEGGETDRQLHGVVESKWTIDFLTGKKPTTRVKKNRPSRRRRHEVAAAGKNSRAAAGGKTTLERRQ